MSPVKDGSSTLCLPMCQKFASISSNDAMARTVTADRSAGRKGLGCSVQVAAFPYLSTCRSDPVGLAVPSCLHGGGEIVGLNSGRQSRDLERIAVVASTPDDPLFKCRGWPVRGAMLETA
jgi:hypothetical protein